MTTLSPETVSSIQRLLRGCFNEKYPQAELTDEQKTYIIQHTTEFINNNEPVNPYQLRVTSYVNVEKEYKEHLALQPDGTIAELPLGYTSALSDRRAFWIVYNKRIYHIQTNLAVTQHRMITIV